MSVTMDIRESETGVVRVFHLDLPPEAIERYITQAGTGEWPLMYGLGAKKLSSAFVDVVDMRDLGQMPLTTYLHEAYSVPVEEMRAVAPRLNALRGHVIVLPSQAFARTAQSITARTPLRWVGTYAEPRGQAITPPLRSQGAKGVVGTKPGKTAGGGSGADPRLVRWLILGVLIIVLSSVITVLSGGR